MISTGRFVLLAATLAASTNGLYGEDIPALEKRAIGGDLRAQERLGWIYSIGEGVQKNTVESIKWYRMALEQGDLDAASSLASALLEEGPTKNAPEAEKLLRSAAEKGNATAQVNLGSLYLRDKNFPKDTTEALKWLRIAADAGDPRAQYPLGHIYWIGEAVPKDEVEALARFYVSSKLGLPPPGKGMEKLEGKLGETGADAARKRCFELLKAFEKLRTRTTIK